MKKSNITTNTSINSIQNENTLSTSNAPLIIYQNNNNSCKTSQTKLIKKSKILNQKNISANEFEKHNNFKNHQKSTRRSMKNISSKLASVSYVKPLYYMMNEKEKPINKQFGYRYDRNFLFIPYPTILNIDYEKFKTITQLNEEKKENSRHKKAKSYKKNNSNNSEKNKSSEKNLENNNNKKNKDINDIKTEKATLIQACFRGYLLRKNLYNSLTPYGKFRYDLKTLDRIVKCKNVFFKKLKQIKIAYYKKLNKTQRYKNKEIIQISNNENFTLRDYNYKINLINKNNIIKNHFFSIDNFYTNNYDKFKNGCNNYEIIDKEIYSKEKELYENKINELIEKNKMLEEKNKQYYENEVKYNNLNNIYNNIKVEKENLNNKIKEILEENNQLKKENKENNEYRIKYNKLNKEYKEMNYKFNELIKERNNYKNNNNSYKKKIEEIDRENSNKINKLLEENKKMREKMEDIKRIQEEKEELNSINNEINCKLNALIEENNKLKEKNNKYELDIKSNIISKAKEEEANIQIKQLIEENNKIKEKNKQYEENETKYNNINQENEKLNHINKEISTQKDQLQEELNELKKKYEQVLKESNDIKEKNKINNDNNQEEDEKDEQNEEGDDDDGTNRNLYLNRIQGRDFMSPEERKLKEERLKKLFRNKVLEMKDYLHRHFMKFYYNGIFMQMKQKSEEDKPTKIVKSKHFSNLINKFNANNNKNNNNNNSNKLNNRQRTSAPSININDNSIKNSNILKKRVTVIEGFNQ